MVIEKTVGESPRFARTTLSHRDNDLFSSSPIFYLSLFFSFSLYRFYLSLLLLFPAIVSLYRFVVVFIFLRFIPPPLYPLRYSFPSPHSNPL